MKLKEIAAAAASIATNHAILIFSRPKFGKTYLAGTAAKIKDINRIFWFDLENGSETLLHMDLTDEEMDKITVYKIADTKETPIGIETMLKAMSIKSEVSICDEHGRVGCADCKSNKKSSTPFSLAKCTHNDLVVIDSGSQMGDSALAACMLGKDTMAKPGWDEYGIQGKWLADILSVIQQCKTTNFVVLTHELVVEEEHNGAKKDAIFPLMGTKPFSMKVAKYFGTVVYLHKKMNKHAGASSSTFRGDIVTGSRVNARLEDAKELNMHAILVAGGIIREGSGSAAASGSTVEETIVVPTSQIAEAQSEKQEATASPKALTLAERLKMKKT